MAWVKLDDQARHHRKVLAVGPTAAWLWVCGLMYCNSQKARDGFIPTAAVAVLYPVPTWRKEVPKLVEVGLWEEVPGGYRIHDYHDYQPKADVSTELAETKAAAGRLGGVRSGEARRRKSEASREAESKQPASLNEAESKQPASLLPKPDPDPVPIPTEKDPPVAPQGGPVVDPVRAEPWRVPKYEVRLARDEWIRAYTAGVIAGCGDVGWTFRDQAFRALERLVASRCPPERRPNIAAWLEVAVQEFVHATKDSAERWSGFSADGFERWWNAGRPGHESVPRKLEPILAEATEGEPVSAEEQAEIDRILAEQSGPLMSVGTGSPSATKTTSSAPRRPEEAPGLPRGAARPAPAEGRAGGEAVLSAEEQAEVEAIMRRHPRADARAG